MVGPAHVLQDLFLALFQLQQDAGRVNVACTTQSVGIGAQKCKRRGMRKQDHDPTLSISEQVWLCSSTLWKLVSTQIPDSGSWL